ncbi:MAG: transposase [Clostridia bacterium]|nr:transposase [Clostridia bacterium]
MKEIAKVVKLELGWVFTDDGERAFPYSDLFEIQRQVALVKNKTIQLCWEWNNFGADFHAMSGAYPKTGDVTGYKTLDGYVYQRLKDDFSRMFKKNLNASVRSAQKAFETAKKSLHKGERSILSYRKDAPIELHNSAVSFSQEGRKYKAAVKVFSLSYAKEKGYAGTGVEFELSHLQGSPKEIVQRCMSGEYKIGESKLIWNEKKKKWFLYLTYKFTPAAVALDPEKIMGVDLGIACVAYMGFRFCEDRHVIPGHEVEHFRRRVEARKVELQRQGKFCGEGRIGHGRATRTKPVDQIGHAIARFRDTANHKYSRFIVDMAVKHGCGVIQMEDLHVHAEDKLLKDWTYFDLRTKLEYKAKEKGIEVRFVNPRYTSQRCSCCGYIEKENRKTQKEFICLECGFAANADYNAALNLATAGIEQIIDEYVSANHK